MHYLVIENKQLEELTYAIAGFLWDNGNEITIRKEDSAKDSNSVRADCMITLDKGSFSLENLVKTGLFIHFCNDGVYSNAIPFPYRLFEFSKLNKNSLAAFFSWCKNLNLFIK